MRKLSVTLASILLALAALALTPYADTAHTVLSGAIAVAALLLLLSIVADRPKVESGPVGSEPLRPAALAPAPSRNQSDAEVVNLLAIFQEKGRLVDFLMGDIAGYSDAEVGAAGRVLHEGAKAALLEHFGILPMREESEGSKITVPTGYAPDEYRLVGRISGEAPFRGTLIHHGWKVDWVKLPRLAGASSDRLPAIAPAEVELQ
ncbi:DUF2760 domain-containing protein [Methylocella tundrae]|uniref:DUF2760 domain-containing protein n=1 Tax=Methylocella tundrae TaxID=227605 RepID=A0A4U8Z592_METTU|nr:DUF2760 domain-containing protein [Methylocella tundrae]WPP04328.1 DUF2760 domain-containing protein [Methylocella tundrae]VFU10665.1 conserved exported protein of unknown function [Methylocella tundrae]